MAPARAPAISPLADGAGTGPTANRPCGSTRSPKPAIRLATLPRPYPGRKCPTRVAWDLEVWLTPENLHDEIARRVARRQAQTRRPVIEILRDADIVQLGRQRPTRRLTY